MAKKNKVLYQVKVTKVGTRETLIMSFDDKMAAYDFANAARKVKDVFSVEHDDWGTTLFTSSQSALDHLNYWML